MRTPVQLVSVLLLVASSSSSSSVTASSVPDLWERGLQQGAGTVLLPRQTRNLQTFTGALGGIQADAVSNTFWCLLVLGEETTGTDPQKGHAVGRQDAAVRSLRRHVYELHGRGREEL